MQQYARLNLVYSLGLYAWYSAITGNIGLCLRAGFWFGFCLRFRLWPVVKVKRPGVPSKANEPVYTRPYACPSQHQVVTIRDAVTMPRKGDAGRGELVSWANVVEGCTLGTLCHRVIG